jgi:two-component system sensor histidine kinase BaeS
VFGFRTGLRSRLIVFCLVIATASIATTTWLTVTSTSSSIRDDYAQNLTSVSDVYNALSGFAATHRSWTAVAATAAPLSRSQHTRIRLTTSSGQLLFDSQGPKARAPLTQPIATVNPLAPDPTLGSVPLLGGIDSRAVGPFAISTATQRSIRAAVDRQRACLAAESLLPPPASVTFPNGRVYIPLVVTKACSEAAAGLTPTAGERRAGVALDHTLAPCFRNETKYNLSGLLTVNLPSQDLSKFNPAQTISLYAGSANYQGELAQLIAAVTGPTLSCVNKARRAQLGTYVAPPAQLYLSAAGALTRPSVSGSGVRRIVVGGALILLITVAVCIGAATTLRRPLARLTGAVQRTAAGDRTPITPVRGTSEMRDLAVAVNNLSQQLTEADRRRQDMVSDVAHELRSPLANLRGWLEALDDGVAAPEPELVTRLLRESLVLQRLVDDLQDLALADAGELAVHPEPVDVARVVDHVLASTPAGSVTLRAEHSGDTVLEADPVRMHQIIANLITNAVRATASGTVTTTVAGEPSLVRVEVVDTGHGIAAADLAHVFDRFWRAEKSRSRSRGGSGLGLAITHALVTAHGGTIEVRSELGRGTVFTVELPREATLNPLSGPPSATPGSPESPDTSRRTLR